MGVTMMATMAMVAMMTMMTMMAPITMIALMTVMVLMTVMAMMSSSLAGSEVSCLALEVQHDDARVDEHRGVATPQLRGCGRRGVEEHVVLGVVPERCAADDGVEGFNGSRPEGSVSGAVRDGAPEHWDDVEVRP